VGIIYSITATDSLGNKSLPFIKHLYTWWPAPGLSIPYEAFGSNTASYRIISMPMVPEKNTVEAPF
jgi:hypothetical protein